MCTLVFIVIPSKADPDHFVDAMRTRGILLTKWPHLPLHRQLEPGCSVFTRRWVSRPCDCGTSVGLNLEEEDTQLHRHELRERERTRLRRKKWSEAKIERHLRQKEEAFDRQDQSDIADWVHLIETALELLDVRHNSIRLLRHDFSQAFTEENFSIRSVEVIACRAEIAGKLQAACPDVLYQFTTT